MAANLIPIRPPVTVQSTIGDKKSDSHGKNWWTPLFGWSFESEYIDSENMDKTIKVTSRVSQVNFTDEKAKKLRMLTREMESFHDSMYHSAIASQLASDFSDRSDVLAK